MQLNYELLTASNALALAMVQTKVLTNQVECREKIENISVNLCNHMTITMVELIKTKPLLNDNPDNTEYFV